jgi:aspartyl-tRNA(Asn)/glutamyl-tRNA(Gln) amidotransferase subunit C
MKLSREQVMTIATLCRMKLSEEEVERFREQLSDVLESFEVLQEIDTDNVPPTAYPIPLQNVTREDRAAPSLPQGDILANAPRQEDGSFKVKVVLEGESS